MAIVTTCKGGTRYEYTLPALPEEIRAVIIAREAAQIAAAIGPADSPEMTGHLAVRNYLEDMAQEKEEKRLVKERGLALLNQLPDARKREAEARYEILQAKNAFIKAGGFKKSQGLLLFIEQYNKGRIDLPDWVFEAAEKDGTLDRSTLYRWESRYDEQGMVGLAGVYGHAAGRTALTPEQQDFVIAMIVAYPNVQIPKIMAGLKARFAGPQSGNSPQSLLNDIPPEHVVAYFVKRYRKENAARLMFLHSPDEARSKLGFAPGSASATITRLNQRWEADATPGDIMLTDGRHAVIGIIDVWSRRPRVLVTPTSKAQAICTLLRRCLIDMGVPEVLMTDNGKDFTARHMERVLDALEIERDLAPPFTPEAKPHIERFFHTFSHGIIELLPGYIGHSVAERKSIEARRSFADRLMKRGEIIDVKLTAREFQRICDRWIDAVYTQDPHSGLDGMTPAQRVRSWTEPVRKIADERALDVLLCPAPKDGGFRFVKKKGVEVDRKFYFNTAMAGYEDSRVRILQDYSDLGRVYCFLESGEFLCVATCPDWYGISAADEASHMKHTQRKINAEFNKEAKRLVKTQRIATLPEEILEYRESLIVNVTELPGKTEAYTTGAIEEALVAAEVAATNGDRATVKNKAALAGPVEMPPEVIAYEEEQKKVVNLHEKRRERRMFRENKDIYFWILDTIKSEAATPVLRQWKRDYEAWLDGDARRPFKSDITLDELFGDTEADAGNQY